MWNKVAAGIVYSTDAALSPKVKVAFTFSPDSHDPIDYYAAVIKTSRKAAEAKKLVEFMRTGEFRQVMTKYGFSIPGKH